MSRVPPVTVAAAAVLAYAVAATVVAVLANWPAQFGAVGVDAGEEWASRGTALSPPVAPLLALAVGAALALRRDRAGLLGVLIVCVVAVLFVIGALGEVFAEPTNTTSRSVLVAGGLASATVAGALLATGAYELRARATRR